MRPNTGVAAMHSAPCIWTWRCKTDQGLKIIIGDDGVGRETGPAEDESGSGLRFHSAMLAVIGGTLSVEDRPDGGTQVVIEALEN